MFLLVTFTGSHSSAVLRQRQTRGCVVGGFATICPSFPMPSSTPPALGTPGTGLSPLPEVLEPDSVPEVSMALHRLMQRCVGPLPNPLA